jgi:membrane protein DedA with SNARE-associated domain
MEQLFQFTDHQLLMAAFILMAANGFASFPASEFIWAALGGACAYGGHEVALIIMSGVFGNVFGTTILFFIARTWGREVILRYVFFKQPFAERLLSAVDAIFAHRGPIVVSTFRCVPLLRSVISVPAGVARMNVMSFVGFTTIGCTVWAGIWFSIGYALSFQALAALRDHRPILAIANLVVVVLVAVIVWRVVVRQISSKKGSE